MLNGNVEKSAITLVYSDFLRVYKQNKIVYCKCIDYRGNKKETCKNRIGVLFLRATHTQNMCSHVSQFVYIKFVISGKPKIYVLIIANFGNEINCEILV